MATSDAAMTPATGYSHHTDPSHETGADHYHRQPRQQRSSYELPPYSAQLIDGVDAAIQPPSEPPRAVPGTPPPVYEHPPAYGASWTDPERNRGEAQVRLQGLGGSASLQARRDFIRARAAPSNSNYTHIILACVVFWLCGFVVGAIAFILAVLARRKQATDGAKLSRLSLAISLTGFALGLVVLLSVVWVFGGTYSYCGFDAAMTPGNFNRIDWEATTTSPPKVASLACHVTAGNETRCFRFASNFTSRLCASVGGTELSDESTALSKICYHNVCTDYVVKSACFQYRSATLRRQRCLGMHGHYVLEPSGRYACYYNDCPGFKASNEKCYKAKAFIPAAACHHGFYESGHCFYNNSP